MAEITGALDAILTSAGCDDKGGVRAIYWTEFKNIDWEAMRADASKFDPVNQIVKGYILKGAAKFSKVEYSRKTAFHDFTYTKEAEEYSLLITGAFQGKSNERSMAFDRAIRTCGIVAHIYGENGTQRVVGVDYNGDVFSIIPEKLSVGRVLDSSGQRGSSKARDEMDLVGSSDYRPLYASVLESNIPV